MTELCWYAPEDCEEFIIYKTPDDKFVPFYPNALLRSKGSVISMDRICCDKPRAQCNCWSVDVIEDLDPRNYFERIGLNITDYAYDTETMNMCDLCIHQYEWSCIPLRNLIRFHNKEGMFPDPLTECPRFYDAFADMDKSVHWTDEYDNPYVNNQTSAYTEE